MTMTHDGTSLRISDHSAFYNLACHLYLWCYFLKLHITALF